MRMSGSAGYNNNPKEMILMKQLTSNQRLRQRVIVLGVALLFAGSAQAGGKYKVTNADDDGEGSLRYGLEVEQASKIEIDRKVGTIEILSTLTYAGEKSLSIKGRGATVMTDLNVTLLALTRGADLKIDDLHFVGPGGFDIMNRGDLGMDAGKGIFVDVRDDQTGTVKLDLKKVSVRGVANHGIHVSDCSLADDCGSGGGGGGDGSPASISVKLDQVTVDDAGNGKFDADGLRVDERGEGDIKFDAKNSTFINVGADGVELDEGNDGNIIVKVKKSDFSANGIYCDPAILERYLPDPDEAEYDESEKVTENDIPGPVSGSPDDSCFEREVDLYDSGFVEAYEFGIDVDDGFDIDEAGDGSLVAKVDRSSINDNFDEGLDFDEEGDGSVFIDLDRTEANGNTDDGYKVSEEDEGGVYGKLKRVVAISNDGNGIVLEEADEGDLAFSVDKTETIGNADAGIEAVEEDEGSLAARLKRVVSTDNGEKGLLFEEEAEGDLKVSVDRTQTAGNGEIGIEAAQEDPGKGELKVRKSDIADGFDLDGVEQK